MAKDDDIRPRLGKIRAKGTGSFRGRILQVVHKAGGFKPASGGGGKGSRSGRGRGISSLRPAGTRRVVVKARFTRLGTKGFRAAGAHLRYLQRDGTTRDGQPGQLYDETADRTDGRTFLDRCKGDRHLFRFIVAPEDGDGYADLKSLTRRLMHQMERDLGTRLDWVAVDHFNTGHPHTHIVVRGRDDHGRDLVISRAYLSEGLRGRAESLVTLDLGRHTEREITESLRREIDQPRLTRIDRWLLRDQSEGRTRLATHGDPFLQSLRAGRLQTLARLGLAEASADGQWSLNPDMETILRDMGRKGDIIKTLAYDLQAQGAPVDLRHAVLHLDRSNPPTGSLIGEVVRQGPLDEFGDRAYLALNASDGRVHIVDIGQSGTQTSLRQTAIVAIHPPNLALRPADHTILSVAARNGGVYDLEVHLALEPSATVAYAETHLRRLEAIRRLTGGVERTDSGAFAVGPDYAERVLAYERALAEKRPVRIERLSSLPLERLPTYVGPTWLDRPDVHSPEGATGFGGRLRSALAARTAWLAAEGLGTPTIEGRRHLTPLEREGLRRRQWERLAEVEQKAWGKPYIAAFNGERVEGILKGYRETAEGRVAIIERSRDFTLVPWRDVLEDHLGKTLSGVMDRGPINWTIGRGRVRGID